MYWFAEFYGSLTDYSSDNSFMSIDDVKIFNTFKFLDWSKFLSARAPQTLSIRSFNCFGWHFRKGWWRFLREDYMHNYSLYYNNNYIIIWPLKMVNMKYERNNTNDCTNLYLSQCRLVSQRRGANCAEQFIRPGKGKHIAKAQVYRILPSHSHYSQSMEDFHKGRTHVGLNVN
jgi:hypothetical protein